MFIVKLLQNKKNYTYIVQPFFSKYIMKYLNATTEGRSIIVSFHYVYHNVKYSQTTIN